MTANERKNLFASLRKEGMTCEEIGRKYGLSRQRVSQMVRGRINMNFHPYTETNCVYPRLRDYLNANTVTMQQLIDGTGLPYTTVRSFMRSYGTKTKKSMIDKILRFSGLTYAQLFWE